MKVFSMFDGVGGFIIGLNNSDSNYYQTTYSNQYEPSRKSQDAYEVGVYRFPNMEHIPDSVSDIPDEKFTDMKDNGVDMIVGGFPCQDYSVARSKKHELGIEGKKGVLFWEIIRATKLIMPKYLILENVDRLLKSPSKQRGRDFAIMLGAFNELGYSVEWRVINAADYGRAQRRRRVFFFVYRNDTGWAKHWDKQIHNSVSTNLLDDDSTQYDDYILTDGLFARQFPVLSSPYKNRQSFGTISHDIVDISDNFIGQIWNTGIMRHGKYHSIDTKPTSTEVPIMLRDILVSEKDIPDELYLNNEKLEKFNYLRGSKKIERTTSDGHTYTFSEGSMSPFDSLDLPGRTMLTSEGSINRSTHLLNVDNKYRLLSPIEAERLQDFPDDWTKFKLSKSGELIEVPYRMRMFFMGNALVTGIVTRIADELKIIDSTY